MRLLFVLALSMIASVPSFAEQPEIPEPLRSALTAQVWLPGQGLVAFRAPRAENKGPVLVLVHGVYGGASHRAFRELYPLLDQRGFRVYLFDLIGTGESVRPKKTHTMDSLSRNIADFLKVAVKEKVTLVAESLAGVAALEASKMQPDLVQSVVMLQPTGIHTQGTPPSPAQQALYEKLMADDLFAVDFYQKLLSEDSVRKYLLRSVYNDALIDDLRIQESTMMRGNIEQRWITFSFIGGQMWRPFSTAAKDVTVPVLAIFGANAEAVGENPNDVENVEEFRAIRPDFRYEVLPETGANVQRERPAETAALIEAFASGN